jgi:hypothetical protein
MTTSIDILEQARRLAAAGCSVIPIDSPECLKGVDNSSAGKRPAIPWKQFQSTRATDDQLIGWFGTESRNIGIVTGVISDLVVVDCDSPEALAWADTHLPPTPWRVRTSKGEHRGYRHPGGAVRNAVRIDTGDPTIKIDVRGDGGYVVGPGSLHASGAAYEWIAEEPASTASLPRFDPAWLKGETAPHDPRTEKPIVAEGGRNDFLFREGCKLRRELAWGEQTVAAVLNLLNDEHCRPPLDGREMQRIAKSCMVAHDDDEVRITSTP